MTERPWRLRIEHVTTFNYQIPARSSYNEVRLVPLTTPRQTTVEARVTTTPSVNQYRYWDYWGTQVVAFDLPDPHDQLQIRAEAVVDAAGATGAAAAAPWPELIEAATTLTEFLDPTPHTRADPHLTEVASTLRLATPRATVDCVAEWVHEAMTYEQGVTGVHTSAPEALAAGKGVCQDFAHLTVALLRQLGIPSRYVSGYLHPSPEAQPGDSVQGQSHAWVEVWTGDWWEIDPTNLVPVGSRHVVVGRARDYSDVAPIKGIYAGGAGNSMVTAVLIARLG